MDKCDAQHFIEDHQHIIVFDGVCNLCSGWVHFIIKRDPSAAFYFCSVQSDAGKALLAFIGLPTDQIETVVYFRSGEVFLRSSACLEIVKALPAGWPILSIGLYIPRVFRDWCYNVIAKNRYRWWGRKTQCLQPSASIKNRFIE